MVDIQITRKSRYVETTKKMATTTLNNPLDSYTSPSPSVHPAVRPPLLSVVFLGNASAPVLTCWCDRERCIMAEKIVVYSS